MTQQLVTGAAEYLGSIVVRILLEWDEAVRGFYCPMSTRRFRHKVHM